MSKILIIDDEPQIQNMLKKLLKEEGYDVFSASDGNEGINMYRANPYDLVITDIIMPEKEGLETIRELKKIDPDVKIIVMTGGSNKYSSDMYLELGVKFGAITAFEKPIRRNELLKKIREIL